jgi:hypothetical protein
MNGREQAMTMRDLLPTRQTKSGNILLDNLRRTRSGLVENHLCKQLRTAPSNFFYNKLAIASEAY